MSEGGQNGTPSGGFEVAAEIRDLERGADRRHMDQSTQLRVLISMGRRSHFSHSLPVTLELDDDCSIAWSKPAHQSQ